LKPSVGAISTVGVLPACRTLDCVSVIALTVDDAWRAFEVMAGSDPTDPFSRPIELGGLRRAPPKPVIGIPRAHDLRFFGVDAAATAWSAAIRVLDGLGARIVEFDMAPFFEAAALLYEGPWIAERHAAIRDFVENHASDMHPVTLEIISGASKYSAVDTFQALLRRLVGRDRPCSITRAGAAHRGQDEPGADPHRDRGRGRGARAAARGAGQSSTSDRG
jgi:allophanate hydrolase